jgi:hypothetical protein
MKSLRFLVLFVMLAGVAACGGEMDTGANANTLQRGLPSDPETLDHHKARSTQAAEVLRDLGEGLAGFTANGELVPAAADSWDISEDGLTYTFRLRDGLRWSNGEALTAEHFVAGMRRLVTPATAAFYAQMIVDIENAASIVAGDAAPDALGVEAVDDRTLVLPAYAPEHVSGAPRLYCRAWRRVRSPGETGIEWCLQAGRLGARVGRCAQAQRALLEQQRDGRRCGQLSCHCAEQCGAESLQGRRAAHDEHRAARRVCAGSRRVR